MFSKSIHDWHLWKTTNQMPFLSPSRSPSSVRPCDPVSWIPLPALSLIINTLSYIREYPQSLSTVQATQIMWPCLQAKHILAGQLSIGTEADPFPLPPPPCLKSTPPTTKGKKIVPLHFSNLHRPQITSFIHVKSGHCKFCIVCSKCQDSFM